MYSFFILIELVIVFQCSRDLLLCFYQLLVRIAKIYIIKKITFWFLAFAFSKSFGLLFIARAIQGVGSACSSVSGKT